jgi:predicted metal-dependent hydrolase
MRHQVLWLSQRSPSPTLTTHDYQPHTDLQGIVPNTVDWQPVLILVDSELVGWQEATEGLKSSNATRRIPIFLLSDDANVRNTFYLHGVDMAFSWQDWLQDGQVLVNTYARRPFEHAEALDCECQETLPQRGIEGIERFNRGEYYAQHDLFEAQWMEETRPVRELYRAILQVGVGYYQIERGNYRGALKTLQKSVQWLMMLPDVCQGVNIKQLREESFRVRAELQRLGEDRLHEFDKALLKPVQWVKTE